MDRVDLLLQAYRDRVQRPWSRDVSGAERVWIAVYPPEIERRLRLRIPEFGLATKDANRMWSHLDLTSTFAAWMAAHARREAYFRKPTLVAPAYERFAAEVEGTVRALLTAPKTTEDDVVAVSGVGTVFPMLHVSQLVQHVASDIRGRLLVFFPGSLDQGNYRLLDARDGWNYLAIPITIPEGDTR
jgi:hypothetical protein